MLKLVIVVALCVLYVKSISGASIELEQANNSSAPLREKRSLFYPPAYNYYGYSYYNWYTVYQTYFTVATCAVVPACPVQCPGTCGIYGGLNACRCNSCPHIGNVCSNLVHGIYLYPFAYDTTRYVQCDPTPGIFYIRTCPSGLIFDTKFRVCNYPYFAQAYTFYGK